MIAPAPLTPKKRRRWLIVAFVLVLVSLGTWWYWPRGDARFVGTWANVEWEEEGPLFFVCLSSNGMGTWRDRDGTRSVPFAWRVDGDRFFYGSTLLATWPRIASMLESSGYRVFPEQTYRIAKVGENRIHLHGMTDLKLRRITE